MAIWQSSSRGRKRGRRQRKPLFGSSSNHRSRSLRLEPFEERSMLAATGPLLLAVIPYDGAVLNNNSVLREAPRELILRFDEAISPGTVSHNTIQLVRSSNDVFGDGNDVTVLPSYLAVGTNSNEVIVRFDQTLPDDLYQLRIVGAGDAPLRDTAGRAFNSGQNVTRAFSLDLGAQVVAIVPQPITRGPDGRLTQDTHKIEVYFNVNDPLDPITATNPNYYQLLRTFGTATPGDDGRFLPTSVIYDASAGKAVLTFAAGDIGVTGTYRLRIGTAEPKSLTPIDFGVGVPGSSFGTARDLGALFPAALGTQTVQVGGTILGTPVQVVYPGGPGEPGTRDIPVESHLLGGANTSGVIPTIHYNFNSTFISPINGQLYFNFITEPQKQRVREVFSYYSQFIGAHFVERDSAAATGSDWTIATADPRALGVPTNVGGVAGGTLAIMNAAIDWGDSETRGGYFSTAMHEIGHLLGLGHAYELPDLTVQGGSEALQDVPSGEGVFPGDADITLAQFLHPPVGNDIHMYRLTLPRAGTLNLETFAERLREFDPSRNPSQLDAVISVFDAAGNLIARNDDYFGDDAFLQLQMSAGLYYVGITSTGNVNYDPNIPNTGFGGTTQGSYQLRLSFSPTVTDGIKDTTGTLLDGDGDGRPGGIYDFWFKTNVNPSGTLFVDKAAPASGTGALGSLTNPYRNIAQALAAATPGTIVRIVGNDAGEQNRVADNLSYNIGFDSLGNPLSDGSKFDVPRGVTVMIDAGAIIKLRSAIIDVGTSAQGIDRSEGALQVLGKVTGVKNELGDDMGTVYFTSYYNNAIGTDPGFNKGPLAKGNWGGLVFRDRAERDLMSNLERNGIFLSYVNHANLSYGGGQVVVNSVPQTFDQIHLVESRPMVTFNTMTNSANSGLSADPNSFQESGYFGGVAGSLYQADYTRVGPVIYGNRVSANSINGLFVRIRTEAGSSLDPLTVSARWKVTDMIYVLKENLIINGQPGGHKVEANGQLTARPSARLSIDPSVIVKSGGARFETGIGASFIAEGTAAKPIIFTSELDDSYGAAGNSDTTNDGNVSQAGEGDWGGVFFGHLSSGSIDSALITYGGGATTIEGGFARFSAIEIHQAVVRVANSTLVNNGPGGESGNRNGRGDGAAAVIFIRGAQPVIINNIIQNNDTAPQTNPEDRRRTAAININVNALNAKYVTDPGRSRGFVDIRVPSLSNFGPLVRGNRIDNNPVNGMVVRGGVLTTDVVWDDTDIVHVVFEQIVANTQFSLSGRIRLQSSASESLVVKLLGENAGLTAAGVPLDIDDRVGGSVQIIGVPNRPVVMTSLYDTSVGAGLTPRGLPQNDTFNLRGVMRAPLAGDWQGIKIDDFSNDRNVDVVNEQEQAFTAAGDPNGTPSTAQLLGDLAKDLKSGDDIRRLGFEVHGAISQAANAPKGSDVDVYSFRGTAGTIVWLDIDRTTQALDTIVELVDANGATVARSDSSINEQANPALLGGIGDPMRGGFDGGFGPFTNPDYFTTNPMDAGMRVILPGTPGAVNTYFVRVRSRPSGANLDNLTGGQSKGRYVLQLRLQNMDERPGSIVRNADIRFADIGIEVIGKPGLSPLLGDTASSILPHNTFATAQDIGNLLTSDRNEISVAGALTAPNDVQWFKMDLNYDLIQSIGGLSNALKSFATMFTVQYADGITRPDTTLSVFDQNGNLILIARDSNNTDAQPRPDMGPDTGNWSHASFGNLDPTLGSVQMPAGGPQPGDGPEPPGGTGGKTYYIAVSSNRNLPTILDAAFQMEPADPLVRLEPINSVVRVVDDRVGSSGNTTAAGAARLFPGATPQELNVAAVPYTLKDVVLFTMLDDKLYTVNPFTGRVSTFINDPRVPNDFLAQASPTSDIGYFDMAMRDDGRLYTFARGFGDQFTAATNGRFTQFSPADGSTMDVRSNPLPTYDVSPEEPINDDGTYSFQGVEDDPGVWINAMSFSKNSYLTYSVGLGVTSSHVDGRMLFVVGNRTQGAVVGGTRYVRDTQNLLFRLNPNTGQPFPYDDYTNQDFFPTPGDITFTAFQGLAGAAHPELAASGTQYVPRGALNTGTFLVVPGGNQLFDGATFSIVSGPQNVVFEFDTNGMVTPGRTAVSFQTTDTAAQIATVVTQAINNRGVRPPLGLNNVSPNVLAAQEGAVGNIVHIFGSTFAQVSFPLRTDAFPGGGAPDLTGLTFLPGGYDDPSPPLYAVGENGGIYRVTNYHSHYGAQLSLVALTNNRFSGLTAGPQNAEGGRYAQMLFATDDLGGLYAYNTAGVPQPIFVDGQTSVTAGFPDFQFSSVFNFQGLAFSPIDYNLWHVTPTGGAEVGHGVTSTFDWDINRLVNGPGGQSFYFGLEDPRTLPGSTASAYAQPGAVNFVDGRNQTTVSPTLSGNPGLFQSYNVPGGTYGSLLSQPFSLAGYSAFDKPTLYFNYSLDTEGANSRANGMRDSFRVFASVDGVNWAPLVSNNSLRSNIGMANGELPATYTASGGIYQGDIFHQRVQEAFDAPGLENENPLGYFQNDFDEFPTTSVGWRQARVDLGDFAGQPNIQLRFDFSTAGSMGDGTTYDNFGHFSTPYRIEPNPTIPELNVLIIESVAARERGQNNAHWGVQVDDFVIGFAGRGEMVTGHFDPRVIQPVEPEDPDDPAEMGNTEFTLLPVDNTNPTRLLVGPYQLNVRRGSEYADILSPFIELNRSINVNDRLAEVFSFNAVPGNLLVNGQTFSIATLRDTLTFTFRLSATGAPREIVYGPLESAQSIATKIANAINLASRTNSNFDVKARVTPTSTQVDLFGPVDVNAGPLGRVVFSDLGDTAPIRIQGQTILQGNKISNTLNAGIVVRPVGDVEANTVGIPGRTGSVAHLPTLNSQQLVPGVTIKENLIYLAGQAGIVFSGAPQTDIPHAVPFGRILNNTIAQTPVGIQVINRASPTILNNIVAETDTGILVDATSTTTVVGASIYQGNGTNLVGVGETNAIALAEGAPLFVDSSRGNFYLQALSMAIDSSVNSLQERPALAAVTSPMGIPPSSIQASDYDLLGQLRIDDPAVPTPPGLGSNVFKDRGAVERADFVGPTAVLTNPVDNSSADRNSAVNSVLLLNPELSHFAIQLVDGSGVGVDDATVTDDQFVVLRTIGDVTTTLTPSLDYILAYDTNTKIARLVSTEGVWALGRYTITLANQGDAAIKDLAGNALQPNQSQVTRFVIELTDQITSPWQNPLNKYDVNGSGTVTIADLVPIVNRLLAGQSGPLPSAATVPPYIDVSGDGVFSPFDAALLITFLQSTLPAQPQAAQPLVVDAFAGVPAAEPLLAEPGDVGGLAAGVATRRSSSPSVLETASLDVTPLASVSSAPANQQTTAAVFELPQIFTDADEDEDDAFDPLEDELEGILHDLTGELV